MQMPSPRDFCCFADSDVDLLSIGNGRHPVLVIDSFLCPEPLSELLSLDTSSFVHEQALPGAEGSRFPGRIFVPSETNVTASLRLGSGEHLPCVRRALRLLLAQGKLSMTEAHLARERTRLGSGAPLRHALLDAWPALHGTGAVGSAARARARALAREAGVFSRQAGKWSLLELIEPLPTDGNASADGWRRLAFLSDRPATSLTHLDSGHLVLNLHLTSEYDDSGTSFWRVRRRPGAEQGVELCGGCEESGCAMAGDLYMCLAAMQSSVEKYRRQHDPNLSLPAEAEDLTGEFEQYASVPVRLNRMVLYSGHLPHGAYFSPAASSRALDPAASRRLMFQEFTRLSSLRLWKVDHDELMAQSAEYAGSAVVFVDNRAARPVQVLVVDPASQQERIAATLRPGRWARVRADAARRRTLPCARLTQPRIHLRHGVAHCSNRALRARLPSGVLIGEFAVRGNAAEEQRFIIAQSQNPTASTTRDGIVGKEDL